MQVFLKDERWSQIGIHGFGHYERVYPQDEDSTEWCGNRNICSDFEAGVQSSVGDVWRGGVRLPHPSVGTSLGRAGAAERP